MPPTQEKSMSERLIKLETMFDTITEQYKEVVQMLQNTATKLEATAIANNEILHLKEEQLAQWKKIDSHKDEFKKELKEVHARIDTHMISCAGPGQALSEAQEARKIAEEAKKSASTANNLPGRYALAIVAGGLLLLSNVIGGIAVYLFTH